MSLQFTIHADFLQSLDPPSSFPPNEDDLLSQIENKFLNECERFIAHERTLYKCSKSIQNRLKTILKSSEDIQMKLSSSKEKLTFIAHELQKYKEQEHTLKDREKILNMLCSLIKMEEMRNDLLIKDYKEDSHNHQTILINEEQYLDKLASLHQIIQQSELLSHMKDEFPLIREIIVELETIFHLAIKFITKKLLTPKMVALILNNHFQMFFKLDSIAQTFTNAIVLNRLQHLKINLNPMINNLNYATNIPELYESIITNWLSLTQDQILLFQSCGRQDIVRNITETLIVELIGKMEKSIFRIKDLASVIRIRKYFSHFLTELKKVDCWKISNRNQQQREWQPLASIIDKCQIIIQSKLTEESDFLQSTKYNIYTLVSYIPIREHLQKIKLAYQFSVQDEKMDWEVAFYNLCSSRDPKNYPNNKSLIIFNLNIWYLYLKIINNGTHREEGEQIMQWSKDMMTNINVQETNKKFYESFEKVLELCGNIPAFKNVLYSELQLLGHEQLRREIAASIKLKYLDSYQKLLVKIQKSPMTNQQVKTFCHAKKINLNKFGKYSHSICIHNRAVLNELLQY